VDLGPPHNWGPVRFNPALRSLTCRYLCYLFFQLKTHADELAEGGGDEAPALSLFGALAMLTCITLVVATNSEYVFLALCTQALSPSLRQLHIALMDFSTMQYASVPWQHVGCHDFGHAVYVTALGNLLPALFVCIVSLLMLDSQFGEGQLCAICCSQLLAEHAWA